MPDFCIQIGLSLQVGTELCRPVKLEALLDMQTGKISVIYRGVQRHAEN